MTAPDESYDVGAPKRVRIAPQKTRPTARLLTREEAVALALDVYRLALDAVRAYKLRTGEEKSYPQPDFRAACEALRIASDISGHGGKQAPKAELEEEDAETAEAALDKLRSKIAKAASLPVPVKE